MRGKQVSWEHTAWHWRLADGTCNCVTVSALPPLPPLPSNMPLLPQFGGNTFAATGNGVVPAGAKFMAPAKHKL